MESNQAKELLDQLRPAIQAFYDATSGEVHSIEVEISVFNVDRQRASVSVQDFDLRTKDR